MKKLYLISVIFILNNIYAAVPVVDIAQKAKDMSTMAQYSAQIGKSINKINTLMNAAEQVKNLQGLQKLQAGTTICELCTKSDQVQLQSYLNSINTDLCSQFSLAYTNITGIKSAVSTLNEIMSLLATNPQAALMALQQAQIASTQSINNTLAQMQMMQAQSIQKELGKEKLSKQTYDAAIRGASNVLY